MCRLGNTEQSRLSSFGMSYMGNISGHSNTDAVFLGPMCRPEYMYDTAILANIAIFKIDSLTVPRHDGIHSPQCRFAVIRMDHLQHSTANHLFGSVSEYPFSPGTDVEKVTFTIHHADSIEQHVEVAC